MMTREKPPWNRVSLAADLYLQFRETEWNIQSKGKIHLLEHTPEEKKLVPYAGVTMNTYLEFMLADTR